MTVDPLAHVPPHIRAWMATDQGFRRVTEIVLDAIADETTLVTTAEVRELVEAAYRRAHGTSDASAQQSPPETELDRLRRENAELREDLERVEADLERYWRAAGGTL